jgi:hypothetical protein
MQKIAASLNNTIYSYRLLYIIVVLSYVAAQSFWWGDCAARLGAPLAYETRYSLFYYILTILLGTIFLGL